MSAKVELVKRDRAMFVELYKKAMVNVLGCVKLLSRGDYNAYDLLCDELQEVRQCIYNIEERKKIIDDIEGKEKAISEVEDLRKQYPDMTDEEIINAVVAELQEKVKV